MDTIKEENEKLQETAEIQKDSRDFTQLKEGQEPFNRSYRGNKEDFGRPGKTFKFFVNGLDNFEKPGLVEVNFKTPKNRVLMKFALLASKMQRLRDEYDTDLSIFDDLLDFLVNYYDVPTSFLDRVNSEELFTVIAFGAIISISPSSNTNARQ